MRDPKNKDGAVTAMQTWAMKILNKEKKYNIARFEDLSFMTQLMRSSLLIISLFYVAISLLAIIFSFKNNIYVLYYLIAFIISIIFFSTITPVIKPFNEKMIIRNIIAVLSFITFLAIMAYIYVKIFYFFIWWYLLNYFASLLFFVITTKIAVYFGKRYVREVGISYNALMLKRNKSDPKM